MPNLAVQSPTDDSEKDISDYEMSGEKKHIKIHMRQPHDFNTDV
jgi:hypothetical protein